MDKKRHQNNKGINGNESFSQMDVLFETEIDHFYLFLPIK
jgi:hypothetical protein